MSPPVSQCVAPRGVNSFSINGSSRYIANAVRLTARPCSQCVYSQFMMLCVALEPPVPAVKPA
jgi:hypothetical protein